MTNFQTPWNKKMQETDCTIGSCTTYWIKAELDPIFFWKEAASASVGRDMKSLAQPWEEVLANRVIGLGKMGLRPMEECWIWVPGMLERRIRNLDIDMRMNSIALGLDFILIDQG